MPHPLSPHPSGGVRLRSMCRFGDRVFPVAPRMPSPLPADLTSDHLRSGCPPGPWPWSGRPSPSPSHRRPPCHRPPFAAAHLEVAHGHARYLVGRRGRRHQHARVREIGLLGLLARLGRLLAVAPLHRLLVRPSRARLWVARAVAGVTGGTGGEGGRRRRQRAPRQAPTSMLRNRCG